VAVVAASLAGVRTITAEDIGYHLAFGEAFCQEGRLVDHCEVLYAPPGGTDADPGPGNWYDAQGRYRFPNANWLTQVIFYAAWAAGGVVGLNVLLAACVAALFVLVALTCLRGGGSPLAAAAAVLLTAMTIYPRLMLRPELLGYLTLMGNSALLAPLIVSADDRRLSRRTMIGVVALQLLYVNLHSYWLLGLALTGVTLLPAIARLLGRPSAEVRSAAASALKQRGGLLLAQALVAFVNPWTWRLAILPFQTLVYMRQHNISGGAGEHPWTTMQDLQRTTLLPADAASDVAGCFFVGVAALVVLAALLSMFAKRWSAAAVLLGMLLVAFATQRNRAVGVLTAMPLAAAVIGLRLRPRAVHWRETLRRCLATGVATSALLAACLVAVLFVRSSLYRNDHYKMRFGLGWSRLIIPVGLAGRLSDLGIEGRLWAEPQSTSSLYFLVRPHPSLQMITNTWAYPPATMKDVLTANVLGGGEQLANIWGVSVAAVMPGRLFGQLRTDENWTLVALADGHAVFVRRDGADAALARTPLRPGDIAASDIVREVEAEDAWPLSRLMQWGKLLVAARFQGPAIEVLQAARGHARGEQVNGVDMLIGAALYNRAVDRQGRGNPACLEDYRRATEIFSRVGLGKLAEETAQGYQQAASQLQQ
jgi:hypothetical protein